MTIDLSSLSVVKNGTFIDISSYNVSCYSYDGYAENAIDTSSIYVVPGKNIIIATGIGDYYGYCMHQLESYIDPISATIKISDGTPYQLCDDKELSIPFSGHEIRPTVCLSVGNCQIMQEIPPWTINFHIDGEKKDIRYDVDKYVSYTCQFKNNMNADIFGASATILPTHKDGTTEKTIVFYIIPHQLVSSDIQGFQDVIRYHKNSNGIQQSNLSVVLNGKLFFPGHDYIVQYDGNQNLGTASCIISGIGNFDGTIRYEYQISGDLSESIVYADENYSKLIDRMAYQYNSSIQYKPNVYVKLHGLSIDSDEYETIYDGDDYVNPGKKYGLISGYVYRNCARTSKEFNYEISTQLSDCQISFDNAIKLNHEEIIPSCVATFDGYGKTFNLIPNVDFLYQYEENGYYTTGNHVFGISGITYWKGAISSTFLVYDDSWTIMIDIDKNVTYVDTSVVDVLTREILSANDNYGKLEKIIIGSQLNSVEVGLLSGCSSLIEADFSNCTRETMEIPEACFDGCISLKTVKFPALYDGEGT